MSSNKTGENLPVMEAFYTIQGEGFHSGRSAYFIRLGGCDVGSIGATLKTAGTQKNIPYALLNQL